jgi:integrase/recombinase XerC
VFQTHLLSRDRRPRTIESYLKDIQHFAEWFADSEGREAELTDITALDIRDYRTHLHQVRGLAPNTVNRRLAGLRVFLEWAVEAGHIAVNPGARIRGIQLVEPAPRWLDRSEQHRLVNELEREVQAAQASQKRPAMADTPSACHDRLTAALRDRAIVVILLHTGLRVLELVQLAPTDVTLSERKGWLMVRDGKGGKARSVALNTEVRQALVAYLKVRVNQQGERLFLGQRGPLGTRQVQRVVKKFARRAGLDVKEASVHSLRHTFGKNLVDAGVSLDQVATLMGHANLNTTRRHTTPGAQDLPRAVERVVE